MSKLLVGGSLLLVVGACSTASSSGRSRLLSSEESERYMAQMAQVTCGTMFRCRPNIAISKEACVSMVLGRPREPKITREPAARAFAQCLSDIEKGDCDTVVHRQEQPGSCNQLLK